MMMLDNIRVLDFTQYLAGPTVTRLMAEMGAEIIKIEQGPGGDPCRQLPVSRDGRSGYFVQQNRGKKSLCLNLDKPEAPAIIKELVANVDIVVENFGPGVMQKRGLEYAALAEINPGIIMASVSAFGRNSPLAHKVGYDYIAQAFAGFMHMTGPRDGAPHPVGVGFADGSAGVHAFAGLGYALFHRKRTGHGQYLDISMVDCLFHMHDVNVQGPSITDGKFVPHRMGPHHELIFPAGIFKGPTGYIVVMALQLQWKNLCLALGRPELEHDPRYLDGLSRGQRRDELIPLVEDWMAGFNSNEEVIARLDECRVPCGPVLSPIDALAHPYFIERGTVRTVHDPILGELKLPGFPLRFSAQPEVPELFAPLLGEHNGEVLGQVLGYADERIASLAASGVLIQGVR